MGKLTDMAEIVAQETRAALQLVYDNLNDGQRAKLIKNEDVRELFERYGVIVDT